MGQNVLYILQPLKTTYISQWKSYVYLLYNYIILYIYWWNSPKCRGKM